jgi:hypothetical protein
MKTIRFTICLLGLIVGSSVLSVGQCSNSICTIGQGSVSCMVGFEGKNCLVGDAGIICQESNCSAGECGPSCLLDGASVRSPLEINLQPRLLDRDFLAAIRPVSGPQCQAADLPKKILFSL